MLLATPQPQQQPGAAEGDGTDVTLLPQQDDSQLADEVCCYSAASSY